MVRVMLFVLCMAGVGATASAQTTPADSAARAAQARDWVTKGDSVMKLGNRDLARADYAKAVDTDHDNVDGIVKPATMLVEDGHGQMAQKLLTDALHHHPNDPRLLNFHVVRPGVDTAGAMRVGGPS
jgi:Tfp pilus assembly protein PilF